MSGTTISFGLGARGLKDKDFISVSDPYVKISRPSPSGGFIVLRTSETKKNTLNPDWNDFLFVEKELNGNDKELKLRIEVFDDDGKKGADDKDKLLGTGFFSLKELEAAALVKQFLPLNDGKKQKSAGRLIVRSFTEHNTGQGGSSSNMSGGGYPSGGTAYPPQPGPPGSSYPSAGGYPQVSGGYPQVGGGYPQVGGGYPQAASAYPKGGGGYPQVATQGGAGYPQGGPGYPQGGPAYPQGGPGYPQGGPAYPQGGPAYPQGQGSFPTNETMFPPSNLPSGPGGFYNPNN